MNTPFYEAIITSLIASLVFWIVFNLIPSAYKHFKIRPRVEQDILDIKDNLLFVIQIPFLQSTHSASHYQNDIRENKLKKEDFENALYGKCLNETQCINEFENRLLAVGKKLKDCIGELDKKLDRIYRYSDYLKTSEILLLKEMGEKLHTYSLDEEKIVIDGVVFQSVNPTLSYMKSNFYELYLLYHELQEKSNSFFLVKRSDIEKYNVVRENLKEKHYFRYFFGKLFLSKKYKMLIGMNSALQKGNTDKAKKRLEKYLALEELELVYIRSFLDVIATEEEYISLCSKIRGEREVQKWHSCIDSELVEKKRFELRNAENKRMVENKLNSVPTISELDNNAIKILDKLFDGYI